MVLIRDVKKAPGFNEIGVETVIGDFSALDLIRQESAKADMVISIGDCDDLNSVTAMLEGLKQKKDRTGRLYPLLHTVGVFIYVCTAVID